MADINMKNLAKVAEAFPPEQAILVRGGHGIGKSALAKLLGDVFGVPVIDLRLSQLTEGDFMGLPKLFDPKYNERGEVIEYGRTEFMPPEWFIKAMNEPVVLLLDEINRATPELMQCGFQLIYDRMIQNKKLHPGTRIVACVNASHHYQVNEMDPALLNRFWTCDLVPTYRDWKKWAENEGSINPLIVEFTDQNASDHWWHNPDQGLQPGKIYPTPRGWDMVNRALNRQDEDGLTLLDNFDKNSVLIRHIVLGLVGDEAGTAFYDFVKNYDKNVTAEDVLKHYSKRVKTRLKKGMSIEQLGTIVNKLVNDCKENEWSKAAAKNLVSFMVDMNNNELAFSLWSSISNIKNNKTAQKNVLTVHGIGSKHIMNFIKGAPRKTEEDDQD